MINNDILVTFRVFKFKYLRTHTVHLRAILLLSRYARQHVHTNATHHNDIEQSKRESEKKSYPATVQ